jgi:hypothetical protein
MSRTIRVRWGASTFDVLAAGVSAADVARFPSSDYKEAIRVQLTEEGIRFFLEEGDPLRHVPTMWREFWNISRSEENERATERQFADVYGGYEAFRLGLLVDLAIKDLRTKETTIGDLRATVPDVFESRKMQRELTRIYLRDGQIKNRPGKPKEEAAPHMREFAARLDVLIHTRPGETKTKLAKELAGEQLHKAVIAQHRRDFIKEDDKKPGYAMEEFESRARALLERRARVHARLKQRALRKAIKKSQTQISLN